MVCNAKMTSLGQNLLIRGPRKQNHNDNIQEISATPYSLLDLNASHDVIIKSELLDRVFKISPMLLKYKADPDMSSKVHPYSLPWFKNARHAASRSPDPRIRNLLSEAVPTPERDPTRHRAITR
jgi:hypothetical protein